MIDRTVLPNGTIISKSDDGTWLVESRVSTELSDKEGQTISINELIKDIPNMMSDNPTVTLGHKDTPLGPIKDVQKQMKVVDGVTVPTLIAKWEIKGNRRYKKWVQGELEKGEYPEVSIKAFAFGEKKIKEDAKGMTSEYPSDFEWVGFALCKSGMNRHVGHLSINGKVIEKSDDAGLLSNPNFKMMMEKLMDEDELPYTEALDTCKELYTDDLMKSMIEKGEMDMPDEEIEAIKKELEALTTKYASLEKSNEDLTKERDDLKVALEKADETPEPVEKVEEPTELTEVQKGMMDTYMKEKMETFEKSFLKDDEKFEELLKAKGIVKAEGGALPPKETDFDILEKTQLEQLGEQIFKERARKGIDDVPTRESMEKESLERYPCSIKKDGE